MRSFKKEDPLDIDDILALSWNWRPSILMLKAHNAGLFNAMANGPKSAKDAATILGSDTRATYLALLGLCGVGLMIKEGDTFKNTEVIEKHFVMGCDDYRGNIFDLDTRAISNWMRIPDILMSGEPIPKPDKSTDAAKAWQETFIKAMDDIAHRLTDNMFDALPLEDGMNMLDIGCGPATYMIEFCRRLPNFSAVCFDRPQSEPVVNDFAEKAGVLERINFAGGDFNESSFLYGGLFDGILISQIIHILSEESCKNLLERAENVLAPGGFIAIHEMTLGPDENPGPAAVFAIQMMLGTKQGSVYTKETIISWFESLSMQLESYTRIDERSEVIIARKPA